MQSDESDRRHAGLERLTFFSDAVFAIAMTLLVIEIRLPHVNGFSDAALGHALLEIYPKYLAFVISFLVVGRFWIGHHTVMGMLAATSPRLVFANLIFLLVVAFMPFPTAIISEFVQLRVGVGFYAGWLILLGLVNHWLVTLALRDRSLVRSSVDDAARRILMRQSWAPVALGTLAFVAGMASPLLALVAFAAGTPIVLVAFRRWAARA